MIRRFRGDLEGSTPAKPLSRSPRWCRRADARVVSFPSDAGLACRPRAAVCSAPLTYVDSMHVHLVLAASDIGRRPPLASAIRNTGLDSR
jgi:hypothetical protein